VTDIVVPPLGETVHEITVMRWLKMVGEEIAVGDPLVEVETDKVETELPSPIAGRLSSLVVAEGATVEIGAVIAVVGNDLVSDDPGAMPDDAGPVHPAVRSPLVRRLIAEHGVDAGSITPTGNDGRLTGTDVRAYVAARQVAPPVVAPPQAPEPPARAEPPPTMPERADGRSEWVAFNLIRRRTAERMSQAHTSIPAVTTAMRVNFEPVSLARAAYRARHGESLTYLPFVARAVIEALRDYPHLNGTLGEDGLHLHPDVHLGIAVALGDQGEAGLLVPVVREAQNLRLAALAQRVTTIADAARKRRIGADELTGSTFTITNAGGFGTLVSTPIINPPEVGIVSIEGIAKEPAVVQLEDGSDAIRVQLTGYLSLTYDHRAIDGAYAAGFLNRVRSVVQATDWHRELSLPAGG
jgi:2-oxoglutarate dehydrogenase E2 component (dihydrolipoamide succinyltransferase)